MKGRNEERKMERKEGRKEKERRNTDRNSKEITSPSLGSDKGDKLSRK